MNTIDSQRKQDHIDLAFRSQAGRLEADTRFFYEPLLSPHPDESALPVSFGDKIMQYPLWVSSMTGGTQSAKTINHRLAKACKKFGLGMGLGSCRMLLDSHRYLEDFNLRSILGNDVPFFANLGIAQVEKLLAKGEEIKIDHLLETLQADGLIIHVNPLQEWLQPEGDRIEVAPILTISELLNSARYPIIVKEVGQGMGYKSLQKLLSLPLLAIEFAAFGGTNFSQVELFRADELTRESFQPLVNIGHTAGEMVTFINSILDTERDNILVKHIIISGGVKSFLDGFYFMSLLNMPSIYAQGSAFLKPALESEETLFQHIDYQLKGLRLANHFLTIKK